MVVVVSTPLIALAHGFGGTHYVADDRSHTYVTTESDISYRSKVDPHFDSVMYNQYYVRTDLTGGEHSTYYTYTDVYWYVTTEVSTSDAACVRWYNSTSTPKKCDQVRVRLAQARVDVVSDDTLRQGICHEVGHSVGFDDSQPETNTGCMSGGSNGTLSTHEIGHINGWY